MAELSGDHHLYRLGALLKAEFLISIDQVSRSLAILETVAPELVHQPGALHAQYERILALALFARGETNDAWRHYRRAERICVGHHDVAGLSELERACSAFKNTVETSSKKGPIVTIGEALQAFATLAIHTKEPETLARELLPLLIGSGAVTSATVTAQQQGADDVRYIASMGITEPASNIETVNRNLRIGECSEGVEVHIDCKTDIESDCNNQRGQTPRPHHP